MDKEQLSALTDAVFKLLADAGAKGFVVISSGKKRCRIAAYSGDKFTEDDEPMTDMLALATLLPRFTDFELAVFRQLLATVIARTDLDEKAGRGKKNG